jgi:predicted nucleotide-binding protein
LLITFQTPDWIEPKISGLLKEKYMHDQVIASRVYVVCGRDTAERDKMYCFLEALGLQPITKETATQWTGEVSPYSDHLIDQVFRHAQAIIVLLTGDDVARLRPQLHKKHEARYEKELTPQPRQDQLFEAGYAFGRSPKRTILLRMNNHMRLFSDIDGRYIAKFSWRSIDLKDLSVRLMHAGCALKLDENIWRSAQLPLDLYADLDQLLRRVTHNSSFAINTIDEGHGQEGSSPLPSNAHEVFVIHGRNKNISNHIFAFLEKIGLLGIPWQNAALSAPDGSPYNGQVLDIMMQRAQAAIVLLTGDDEAALKEGLYTEEDTEDDMRILPQPRPNVLFEAGMVFSNKRLATNTILVQICEVRICQSLSGRNRINLTNKIEDRRSLAYSLRYKGCAVKMPTDKELRDIGNFRC